MKPVVHVFARWWAEGPVKTRLAAAIGAERARRAYRRLAECCWAKLADPAWDRWLWVEPAAAADRAGAWLAGAARVLGQPAGDLGDRLLAAFAAATEAGAPWSAVAGTDAPELDAARLRAAASALAGGAEAALIPAHDGGYALLAARRPHPELFRAIPWGTAGVADATRAAAAAAGIELWQGEPVHDVDTREDLERAGLLDVD
ncbi:MAG: DUF2064 domain-containing protein [Planctomycetota bacterium]|nr:MAG: DUF2064 domain-containing protein [Planctomycetota bacterium]